MTIQNINLFETSVVKVVNLITHVRPLELRAHWKSRAVGTYLLYLYHSRLLNLAVSGRSQVEENIKETYIGAKQN